MGLKIRLPEDFGEFLTRFGPGEFCGCLSIFDPQTLLRGQELYRQMYSGLFYWDGKKSALSQSEVLEAAWLARGLDGDEVVCLPKKPPGLYLLPRNKETISPLGATWVDVLESFGTSGLIYRPNRLKWFCTFKDRCRLHLSSDDLWEHTEVLALVRTAFQVEQEDVDENEEYSMLFCPKIMAYVQVYSGSIDIHHDTDFDDDVCRAAEQIFSPQGFTIAEHYVPVRID